MDEIKCLLIFYFLFLFFFIPFIAIQGEANVARGTEASEVIASSLS